MPPRGKPSCGQYKASKTSKFNVHEEEDIIGKKGPSLKKESGKKEAFQPKKKKKKDKILNRLAKSGEKLPSRGERARV